ncbi:hypothetical protein [Gordonia hankookensis]|uniref:Secreted protein n=1 Tax=Gordonia hankookensis TaxID=589403 RepID=A0ABR7WHA0_9ACTN|nr:hypothetical protein [Gordonia hankookensis]MBD1321853.1 hypothetical protein [Gordonia hankookensis]
MEVVAVVISALSLLVAGLGTYQANKRANDALAASHKAAADARWSAVQEAVQRLIGFDPAAEPVGERLQNLRIAMISLVDQLEGWDGIDAWLDAERTLGATLADQVLAASRSDDTVEQRVRNLDPLMSWAHVLSQNLRRFRSTGHNAAAPAALRANAEEFVRAVCEQNGWGPPPSTNPRIQPLS